MTLLGSELEGSLEVVLLLRGKRVRKEHPSLQLKTHCRDIQS